MGQYKSTEALVLPRLEAGDIVLREFRDTDLELIREASSDPHIPLITSVPADYSEAEGLAFIQRQRDRLTSKAGYAFVIANRADDRALGAIGVWIRNIDLSRAAVGYWLGSSARGRGVAAVALLTVSDWALENLEIVRLELFVEEWNIASWRTAEKTGFIREGLLRKWELIGGVWKDLYVYSKVRESK
ncbi:MAG: GNAT family N-acetyltransferase [Candidatus Dormibacteraeota bacterium]|nr:GNAT family N-acetyltransferase [Candidatus Dormibacteraeota bacterium]